MTVQDLISYIPQKDHFYFVLPWGLGDTMIFCGFKKALEKKLDGKICPVIKPSHEIILKMYGINDFIAVDFVSKPPAECPLVIPGLNFSDYPEKGQYYFAHPEFHPRSARMVFQMRSHAFNINFLSWYKEFFELPENTPFQYPVYYPKPSEAVIRKFSKFYPDRNLSEAVLILPEAVTVMGPARMFWEYLIQELYAKHIPIVTNIMHPETTPLFTNVLNYNDLSLEQLIAFAFSCGEVYALRSGICDLLFKKSRKLHIFYPSEEIRDRFSIHTMFPRSSAQEQLYSEFDFLQAGFFLFRSGCTLCATHQRVLLQKYKIIPWKGKVITDQKELVNQTTDWQNLQEIDVRQECNIKFSDLPVCVRLLKGFSCIEAWGVWTEKMTAEFTWQIPRNFVGKKLVLTLKLNTVLLNTPSQRLNIFVNEVKLVQMVLTQQYDNIVPVPIPAETVLSDRLTIKLKVPDALVSPHDIDPANVDIRHLGVGLVEANLEQVQQQEGNGQPVKTASSETAKSI